MFSFIVMGMIIVILQFLGFKQKKEVQEVVYVLIGVNFVISFVISVVVFFVVVLMFYVMGFFNELMFDVKVFLQVVGGLLFIQVLIMMFSVILKSYGYMKDMMFVMIGMNILNIVGNFFVIFGLFGLLVLGVVGVVMLMFIVWIIGLVVMIVIVKKCIGFGLIWKKIFYVYKEYLWKLLKIGILFVGEQLFYNIL